MHQPDQEDPTFTWELLPGEEINECPDCVPLRVVEADPAAPYGLVLREWHGAQCPTDQAACP